MTILRILVVWCLLSLLLAVAWARIFGERTNRP